MFSVLSVIDDFSGGFLSLEGFVAHLFRVVSHNAFFATLLSLTIVI